MTCRRCKDTKLVETQGIHMGGGAWVLRLDVCPACLPKVEESIKQTIEQTVKDNLPILKGLE